MNTQTSTISICLFGSILAIAAYAVGFQDGGRMQMKKWQAAAKAGRILVTTNTVSTATTNVVLIQEK